MTRWIASASFALSLALSLSPTFAWAEDPPADPPVCDQAYVDAITNKLEACDGIGERALQACEAEYVKANSIGTKVTQAQQKKKDAEASRNSDSAQQAGRELNEVIVAQTNQLKKMKEVCKREFALCKSNCASPEDEIAACQAGGSIPEELSGPLGKMNVALRNCAAQETRLIAGADALLANLAKLSGEVAKGKCDTAASENCEETPEKPGTTTAGNGTDTSGSGTDTTGGNSTTDPKKNTQSKGNADMSGVMAAAASLMQAAMTPPTTTPPPPMQPAELPADHCARPENKNELVCMCQGSGWSLPQCRQGQEVQPAQAMGGEITGGGGAKLVNPTAANGGGLNLPSMPSGIPAMGPPPPEGGGGGYAGGGGYGGGGGGGLNTGNMRPSGPDRDDRPTGSALSADILSGGRGGGGFGGVRAASSAPRNPEGLPGYALGLPRAGAKPDLQKFEPSMTPPAPPPRIIAGQVGERRFDPNLGTLKLHPPSTVIWKPITQRYRALDHTFEP